jgi:hypothetical protein
VIFDNLSIPIFLQGSKKGIGNEPTSVRSWPAPRTNEKAGFMQKRILTALAVMVFALAAVSAVLWTNFRRTKAADQQRAEALQAEAAARLENEQRVKQLEKEGTVQPCAVLAGQRIQTEQQSDCIGEATGGLDNQCRRWIA